VKVHVFKDATQCGQACAALIIAQVTAKPDAVLGLATGSSPIPAYQALIAAHKAGAVDFSHAISYNLDEYAGIEKTHPCSYHAFMQAELFEHINIKKENTHLPNGNAADLAEEGMKYDSEIANAGGIDLQLLGIGGNGHIGFNEPGDSFTYASHAAQLAKSTIEANRRFFACEDDVPKEAISMGIGSIMQAKQVVLIATGKNKAAAIKAAVQGEITPQLPASILRVHPNVIFLLDEEAASLL
jgi:glucosamine-6-phosphate isomerase